MGKKHKLCAKVPTIILKTTDWVENWLSAGNSLFLLLNIAQYMSREPFNIVGHSRDGND